MPLAVTIADSCIFAPHNKVAKAAVVAIASQDVAADACLIAIADAVDVSVVAVDPRRFCRFLFRQMR